MSSEPLVAPHLVHVRIGQLALGHSPMVLKATLGSCVGIALLWPDKALYALAHCLLPYAPPQTGAALGGRYVDQAVCSMLRLLKAQDKDCAQIQAHVAGGANMRRPDSPERPERPTRIAPHLAVGQLNIQAAEKVLSQQKIALLSRDVGGFCARQMVLDCAKAHIQVLHVPTPTW